MEISKKNTDVKNRFLDYVGEGKGGMIWENTIETCILPYVKQTTSASSTREAGHSKLVLWDNPVRWGGGGSVDIWQNPPQICKVISLQLK